MTISANQELILRVLTPEYVRGFLADGNRVTIQMKTENDATWLAKWIASSVYENAKADSTLNTPPMEKGPEERQSLDLYVDMSITPDADFTFPTAMIEDVIHDQCGQDKYGFPLSIRTEFCAFDVAAAVARNTPKIRVNTCSVACVPAGSAAPAYPNDYMPSAAIEKWQEATLARGNITVRLATQK